MQYQQKTFTVPAAPTKLGCCERCVYKNLNVPHDTDCKNAEHVEVPDWFVKAYNDYLQTPEGRRRYEYGPQLAPGQSFEEYCDLYQSFG